MAHVGAQPLPRVRPTTWRFDLTLRLPAFSSAEDVRLAFLAILEDAQGNRSISGLKDLSYSYNMPEHGGTAHISGYLHASSKISEAFVTKWLFDDRIIPGNTHWTPVEPGQNGDWRQHASIRAIFAACEDGDRQFEPWMQEMRPEKEWTGGRRKKTPVEAGESGTGAVAGGAGRGRGRPRNPPAAVEGDTPEQAAVRPILSKMQVGQLLQLCSKMNVDCGPQILKEDLLAKFMRNHDAVFRTYSHLQADAAATFAAAATMTPLPPPAAATL